MKQQNKRLSEQTKISIEQTRNTLQQWPYKTTTNLLDNSIAASRMQTCRFNRDVFEIVAISFFLVWGLGLAISYTFGGFIYLLLVPIIIAILLRWINRIRAN